MAVVMDLFEVSNLTMNAPEKEQDLRMNYGIFQTVLNVIIGELGLSNIKVEFDGNDGKKIKELKDKAPQSAKIFNYNVISKEKTSHKETSKTEVKSVPEISPVQFSRLQNKVNLLMSQTELLSTMLPSNDALQEKVLASPHSKPVCDMVTIISLSKRINAHESGLDRLSTLIEKLFRDQNYIRSILKTQTFPNAEISFEPLEFEKNDNSHSHLTEGLEQVHEAIRCLRHDFEELTEKATSLINSGHVPPSSIRRSIGQVEELKEKVAGMSESMENMTNNNISETLQKKLDPIEKQVTNNENRIRSLESLCKTEIHSLVEQYKALELELGVLTEKVNERQFVDNVSLQLGSGKRASGRSSVARESVMVNELNVSIQMLQQEMEDMSMQMHSLVNDQEQKHDLMRKLMDGVDKLEMKKLDKDYVEDMLAGKADAILVNRKVSYDQFDTSYNEMTLALNDALKKLGEKEGIWTKVINEVQDTMKNKLDRMEISPLKDYINAKLKVVHQKMKAIIAEKMDVEAAGTRRVLRDVKCISCDKEAYMRADRCTAFKAKLRPDMFPATKSMKPYLAYELDQVRKQQRQLPFSRDLNDLVKVIKSVKNMKKAAQPSPQQPGNMDHLCTRYCGGSHTNTSPSQRVARDGHFIESWLVKEIPRTEEEKVEAIIQEECT